MRGTAAVVCLGLALVATAPARAAQVWSEVEDARSFPDLASQMTRGQGPLTAIAGATSGADPRDAYCIKVVDPHNFVATTDPDSDPGASADFNTRLLLFSQYGEPVLANDDTLPTGAPFLSTLEATATDGSGFVLSRPGEYVLVVAGSPADPLDPTSGELFALDDNPDLVLTPNPSAGRFWRWEGASAASGSYSVALTGVEPCQSSLDLVIGGTNSFKEGIPYRLCGDVAGQPTVCREIDPGVGYTGEAIGFVDGDANLDIVLARESGPGVALPARVCFGDGAGGFESCADIETAAKETLFIGVAVGFVDGDFNLDAVFIHDTLFGEVCLGDGAGGFSCSPFVATGERVDLGYLDEDAFLDAVIVTNLTSAWICLGDGLGGFDCVVSENFSEDREVELAHLDGDGHLDAVFVDFDPESCLGDGAGGFGSCRSIPVVAKNATDVALGFVDDNDTLDAVFTATSSPFPISVCLGDGAGGFACSALIGEVGEPWSVALGLLDEDQHVDAVFGKRAEFKGDSGRDRVCFGDGAGNFSSCRDLTTDEFETYRIVLGEFGPGDPTLFADGFESGDFSSWSVTIP